jgi:hypothetical protein
VQYGNHNGEHITAIPQLVVLPGGGGSGICGANNKKAGRHMAAPLFALLGAYLALTWRSLGAY